MWWNSTIRTKISWSTRTLILLLQLRCVQLWSCGGRRRPGAGRGGLFWCQEFESGNTLHRRWHTVSSLHSLFMNSCVTGAGRQISSGFGSSVRASAGCSACHVNAVRSGYKFRLLSSVRCSWSVFLGTFRSWWFPVEEGDAEFVCGSGGTSGSIK